MREITLTETVELIRTLGNGKAFGHDTLDAMTLKLTAPSVLVPLQHLINLSISTSTFANKWHIGRLIPLHKGKQLDKMSSSSYRPISLLPTVSKLIERAIQKQVIKYMIDSEQLNDNHNAYSADHSTVSALLQITDALHEANDANEIATIMTVDESAAFDCVVHEILDRKLELYKFGHSARIWFSSFLSHRSQYVAIGGKKSSMRKVTHGVPQGSVLGPLMFTIYVNELPAILQKPNACKDDIHRQPPQKLFKLNCNQCGLIPCFADDITVILRSDSRDLNQIQLTETLIEMNDYLRANKLTMNQAKTTIVEVMLPQKKCKTKGSPPHLDTVNYVGEPKIVNSTNYTRIWG